MPDYLAVAQKGVRITEDAGDEEAIFELGPLEVRALTATETLTDDDMGRLITNTGAAGAASARPITLPAPGASGGKPLQFADVGPGMRLVAPATKTIRVGNKVTIAAGYIESQYACMFEIWSIDANTFMVKGDAAAFEVETS